MLVYLVVLFFVGLFVGGLGRLAVPGPNPMGLLATAAVGIAGSILGGLVGRLLFGRGGGGVILAVLCATLIVWLIERSRRRVR